jgi:hypothetical protein
MTHLELHARWDFDMTRVTASGGHGDFLNSISPAATDAKYKDSASVDRTTYKEIGTRRFTVQ